ncbi:Bgr_08870 family protein [Bartonella doshiae]|uniref:Bgr_08870 family protein n=1 Tax=Bartonella doshiae TaxID=33044 RepID=UPI0009424A6A|nr:Bgr_08870 family protein [Bartonella doshiae]
MTKTKKLDMELPKEGRFISSEFPILRENLTKIDQTIADVEEQIEGKAPLQHTHSISDVTDLEAALKAKMAADKTFTFADLSDIEGAKDAASNYVLYKASNNSFTFGSAISLLGAHQHKIDDIVGLDDFRAKINEDLTSYGRLAQANEWQNYNKFTSKVTMSSNLELLGNASLNLIHNGEVVTNLSATGSMLKGPATVDGNAIYTKDEATTALQKIRNEIAKLKEVTARNPLEILMTESGTIPFPDSVTSYTDIEIWAWGGGGGGGSFLGGGGGGGGCVRIQIRGYELRNSRSAQIGRGGKGGNNERGGEGGQTIIQGLLTAGGGGGGGCYGYGTSGSAGSVNSSGQGGSGGNYYTNNYSVNGSSSTFGGGSGGSYAYYRSNNGVYKANIGHGGSSIYGGAGGACCDGIAKGGYSGKGGNGGDGNGTTGGGGGGYFPGKSGRDGGNGGDGAILFRFFI